MTTRRVFTLCLLLPFIIAGRTNATVTVQESDLVFNGLPTYQYSLTYTDLLTTNKFFQDFQVENMGVETGSTRFIHAIEGETSAVATIIWDFSETGFLPTNVVFKDSFSLFGYNDGARNQGTSSFSVDGSDWTAVTTWATSSESNHSLNPGTSFPLSQPTQVMFRVEFAVLEDDAFEGFDEQRVQWIRSNQQMFEALFNFATYQGPVMPAPGDIVDTGGVPTYTYRLTDSDMATTTKFFNNFDVENMLVNTVSVRHINALAGETTASATIVWDFSGTGYAPTNVVFKDSFSLFRYAQDERNAAVSSFSVNGTDWTEINAHATNADDNHSVNAGAAFALNSPSTIYYRIEFSVLPDDGDDAFTAVGAQWNRANQQTFEAAFELEEADLPDPPPVASGIAVIAGSLVSITLASENGIEYELQYTTDLTAQPQIWTQAPGANASKTGDGDVIQLEDDEPVDVMRVYRILRL